MDMDMNTNTAPPRNRSERRAVERAPERRRPESATDLVANPPEGWTVDLVELGPPTNNRKRLRLLVMQGENGYRVLPFMTVRVMKRTTTEGGEIEVEGDLDLLPHDPISRGLEAGIFAAPEVIEALAFELATVAAAQKAVVPVRPHSKELTQRPFAAAAPILKAAVAAAAVKPRSPKKLPPRRATAASVPEAYWGWWAPASL